MLNADPIASFLWQLSDLGKGDLESQSHTLKLLMLTCQKKTAKKNKTSLPKTLFLLFLFLIKSEKRSRPGMSDEYF